MLQNNDDESSDVETTLLPDRCIEVLEIVDIGPISSALIRPVDGIEASGK